MSWVSGNCQGDRNYECYYESVNPVGYDEWGFPIYAQWCKDSDDRCFEVDNGGVFVDMVDHTVDEDGGGW